MRTALTGILLVALSVLIGLAEPRTYQGFFHTNETGQFTRVIRNLGQLDEFRKTIPARLPQMKQPAPANQDPLLSDHFDFSKEMIVVAGQGDTLSARPKLVEVVEGARTKLVWGIPEKPPEAKPYGMGAYRAVVLPASDKEIVFVWKSVEE